MSETTPLNFDDFTVSDAQQTLVRLLRRVLSEDEKSASILLDALQAADKEALPSEPEELLDFVRSYMTDPLTKVVGPNLTIALINDLSAEIKPNKGDGARVNTPHVAVPVRPPPKGAVPPNGIKMKLPFPKLRQSVANLVRTASTRIRAAVASAKTSQRADRLPVLLVHPDRLVRASIARALVNARFDVTGFDSTPQLIPVLRSCNRPCIAILDVWEKGVEATLRSFAMANPDVRILAWTDIEATVAESVLGASGIGRFAILPRAAAEIELVEATRKLVPPPS